MKAVSEKIGERSFSVNPDGAMNSFGDILSLGPCCLYGNNECYYRASADDAFSSFGWTGVKAMINGKEVEIDEDGNFSVEQYVAEEAKKVGGTMKIAEFVRFEKGEGLEKRQDDFAAEVASMMQ